MLPFIAEFTINGQLVRVPSYGIFLVLAFSSAYFLSLKRSLKVDIDPRHIENLFILTVVAAIIGSRLFHVLFEDFGYYRQHPGKIIAVWEGGYTLYGGILMGMFGMFQYCFIRNVSFLKILDIASEATAFGIFVGRLGCFAAGCCWGTPTDLPWGVIFTKPGTFTDAVSIRLHPTQLYESILGLGIFLYTRYRNQHLKYIGQVFFHSLLLYSVGRFVIEQFRGDDYRGFMFGGTMSYSQFVSLAIIPFTLWGIFREKKKQVS